MASIRLSLSAAALALALGLGCLGYAPDSRAAPITYDFESFSDGDVLGTQIAGLRFQHAQVLTAGASLNEFDFPPASGANVVIDLGEGIRIDFSSLLTSVGAYFIYVDGLTFSAYDAGDQVLDTVSRTGQNLGGPGARLSLNNAAGRIAYVLITGSATGDSFILDDLTIDSALTVPEPRTLTLVAGLLAFGCLPGGWLRRAAQR